jgi:transketolase
MKAREQLEADGIPSAVVSMPCCELFDMQDQDYRLKVLGVGTVRIAIEAAVRFGWDSYLGDRGGFVGMKGFGASASAEKLYEHFGITPNAVVLLAKNCFE